MYKLAYLSTYHKINDLINSISTEAQVELQLYSVTKATVPAACEQAIEDGCQAILARPSLSEIIESLHLPIPYVICESYCSEDFSILLSIKLQLEERGIHRPRIGFIKIPNAPFPIFQVYSELMGIEMIPLKISYDSEEELRENKRCIQEAHLDAICLNLSAEAPYKDCKVPIFHNFTPFFYESITEGIKNALRLLTSLEGQKSHMEELENIISFSYDALICTDEKGIVLLYNPKAGLLFPSIELNKTLLWELLPFRNRGTVLETLHDSSELLGESITIGNFVYIVNISGYTTAYHQPGYICHISEFKKIEHLADTVRTQLRAKGHYAKWHFSDIIGNSRITTATNYAAEQFAHHNSSILIIGESGTGKEMYAQSIHNASYRKDGPFVAINCSTIPLNLLESELFGYVNGSFTGANSKGKKGLFEMADTGTIFLDEISEMDLSGQARLLRVLAEHTIMRIGDDTVRPVDVRVITATNRNLPELIQQGKFREDLYYRINVLTLPLSPLRERKEDILPIFYNSLNQICEHEKLFITLTKDAEYCLTDYDWPGNIRQLRNFCERLVILAPSHKIDASFVKDQLRLAYAFQKPEALPPPASENNTISLNFLHATNERDIILQVLKKHHYDKKATAVELGISYSTLWRRMKKLGLDTT